MAEIKTQQSKVRPLIPITRWNEKHAYPSERQLRWMVFKAESDFEKCIVKIGKRVLIDEEAFFRWVDAQQLNQAKR